MDIFSTLILAAIFISIGFLIGQLINVSGKNKITDQQDLPSPDLVDVLCDPKKDRLVVKVGDQIFVRSSDLEGRERDLIHKTILQLNTWLDAVMPIQRIKMTDHVEEVWSKPEEIVIGNALPDEEKPRLSFSPIKMMTNALRANVPQSQLPSKSIISQIDDILQEKLENSAQKNKAVRLMELPGKGMVVMVGLDRYEGLEDVPDEDIRALIRSAVKEWEQNA